MKSVELLVPDDVYAERGEDALRSLAQEALVVKLYTLGEVGSGRAAQLLDMSRREFLTDILSRYGAFAFDEDADLMAEVARS